MRTIVLSDCHGRPELITNALSHAKYDREVDRLIFAGDIVDIGYHEWECFELLVENGAEMLWGNHDAAMILGERICPQQIHEEEFETKIYKNKNIFKNAVEIDGILVTHAGLSFDAHMEIVGDCHPPIGDMVDIINMMPLRAIYKMMCGPMWYRPTKANPWYNKWPQISGHTPIAYAENLMKPLSLHGFYMVDPWHAEITVDRVDGYDVNGEDSFRYAEVIDGKVAIYDSVEIKRNE